MKLRSPQYNSTREALRLLISPKRTRGPHLVPKTGQPLSDFTLTAPIAGTVTKRNLTIGAFVTGDESVMTIIDLRNVWVLVNVFEHDLSSLQVGEPAEITVGRIPGRTFSAESFLISVTPLIVRTPHGCRPRIDVPNPRPSAEARDVRPIAQITTIANKSREVLTGAPPLPFMKSMARSRCSSQSPSANFAVRPVTLRLGWSFRRRNIVRCEGRRACRLRRAVSR